MLSASMRKRNRERQDEEEGYIGALRSVYQPSLSASRLSFRVRLPHLSKMAILVVSSLLVALFMFQMHDITPYEPKARPSTPIKDVDRHRSKRLVADQRTRIERVSHTFPRVVWSSMQGALRKNISRGEPTMAVGRRRRIKYPMTKGNSMSSGDYEHNAAEPMETEECTPNKPWQTMQYPTCNSIHEMSLAGPYNHILVGNKSDSVHELIRMVNNGYWRDVWVVPDFDFQRRVIKTLRYDHDYTDRNIDRNRRDAMALERLTSSRHVVDVYGYCSTTAAFEFSDGGDIFNELWSDKNITSLRKLQIATQAAMGLADAHTFDFKDRATIAHTDIAAGQWIMIKGMYKLNDFNRARFILRNKRTGENCPYFVGKNPGKNRSPEEYNYDPQSEKVDVYSFGNILYLLLQEETPFYDVGVKTARKEVQRGNRPPLYADLWNSTDPAIQAMKEAMILCHIHNQTERATMQQVESLLKSKLEAIDPGRLKEWGDA